MRTLSIAVYFIKLYSTYNIVDNKTFLHGIQKSKSSERERERERERLRERDKNLVILLWFVFPCKCGLLGSVFPKYNLEC